MNFLLLELFLVLNRALFQVLHPLLQLPLIDVELLSTRNGEVCGRLANNLSTHFGEAGKSTGVLGPVGLESLLDDVNLLLDHVHRLEEVVMELLTHFLDLRL